MKYYKINPEVVGGLGEETQMDEKYNPPKVQILHFVFEGWLGDDLVEGYPCFLISENIKNKIQNLTGFRIENAKVTPSEQFYLVHPNKILEKFFWLKIHGKAQEDDFGISEDFYLIVSEKALAILQTCNLHYADIEEVSV